MSQLNQYVCERNVYICQSVGCCRCHMSFCTGCLIRPEFSAALITQTCQICIVQWLQSLNWKPGICWTTERHCSLKIFSASHKLFPNEIRCQIQTVMLIASRPSIFKEIPRDVIFLIFELLREQYLS